MRQWFGVSANAFLNTRWTQFINHANYKIIDSNVMDWANVKKIHTPPSAKRYFPPPPPPTSMRCAKTISRLRNQPRLRWKRRQDQLKTAAPLLFANKSTVKHATWSNSCCLWYTVHILRAVCNASLLFLFSQLIAKKAGRALYFGISLAIPSSN